LLRPERTHTSSYRVRAMIYLDYNATAPVCKAAQAAVQRALQRPGNPSSVHRAGVGGRRLIDEVRREVLRFLNASDADVVFTSGGTEANNLAVFGTGLPVVTSTIEHDSVLAASKRTARGHRLAPVDGNGLLDLERLKSELAHSDSPSLFSLMLANNETGAVQPVKEATQLAHDAGALVHCDAVQGPGKIPVNMEDLGVDLLTLSGHKFGGPMGVGALVVRKGVKLHGIQVGGGQEAYRRAGTQNVPGIAGFGAALSALALADAPTERLRDQLEARCIALGATIVAPNVERLPNTSCLAMPGVPAETQVMAFDLEGIAVSAGAACSSGKVEPSHVLAAMELPADIASSAIRVSLGPATTSDEIDRFVDVWAALSERHVTRPAACRIAS